MERVGVRREAAEDELDAEGLPLELVAADRPGLLLQLGTLFEEHAVVLHNAKITTLGERAEDVFFITTDRNKPLDGTHCERLVEAIENTLSASAAH